MHDIKLIKKSEQETITIDGKTFKVVGIADWYIESSCKTIYSCYNRPSIAKQNIFDKWSKWFVKHQGSCGVCSYNSNFFTIDGHILYDGIIYYAYITATRQELIILDVQ